MFLCDTSSMKTDSFLMTSVLSLRPSKKSPKKARCFWPVCNSTRFLICSRLTLFLSIHWISPLMLLHRCLVELLTPPQLQPGLRLYTCHMPLPMPTIFDVKQQQQIFLFKVSSTISDFYEIFTECVLMY